MAGKKESYGMDLNNLYSNAAPEKKEAPQKKAATDTAASFGYEMRRQPLTETISFLCRKDTKNALDELRKKGHYKSRNELINEILENYIQEVLNK